MHKSNIYVFFLNYETVYYYETDTFLFLVDVGVLTVKTLHKVVEYPPTVRNLNTFTGLITRENTRRKRKVFQCWKQQFLKQF